MQMIMWTYFCKTNKNTPAAYSLSFEDLYEEDKSLKKRNVESLMWLVPLEGNIQQPFIVIIWCFLFSSYNF